MKIDVENINKLIELSDGELGEEDLVRFVLLFDKIVNIINSSGEECELKLNDYKLTARKKNYNNKSKKLTINVKRNRK